MATTIVDEVYASLGHTQFSFTRNFTKGTFSGMTMIGTLWFPTKAEFDTWIRGVNRNHKRGTVDYFVTV